MPCSCRLAYNAVESLVMLDHRVHGTCSALRQVKAFEGQISTKFRLLLGLMIPMAFDAARFFLCLLYLRSEFVRVWEVFASRYSALSPSDF
jgi:hypothetical protein